MTMRYEDRASLEVLHAAARHVRLDDTSADEVATYISLVRGPEETPAQFVKRITLASLSAATERAAR